MSRKVMIALAVLMLAIMLIPQGISAAQGRLVKIPLWHGVEDAHGTHTIAPSSTVIVYYIWVARTAQQVEEFKTHADITLTLDGQTIFEPRSGVDAGWRAVETGAGGTVARAQWIFQLPALGAGTHTLQTIITLDAPVSDGIVQAPFAGVVNDTTNMLVVSSNPAASVVKPNPTVPVVTTGPVNCNPAVGTFIKDAVGYWGPDPGKPIQPELIIPRGKSLWTFGMDATHRYYQVLLDALLFWVEVDTLGPTQDEVWHNTPLPNCVVQ